MNLEDIRHHLSLAPTEPLRARQAKDYGEWDRWLDMYTSNWGEDALSYTERVATGVSFHFAITVDDRINGKAFISTAVDGPRYRFATVTAGAILSIHQICFYAMSRRDVLPSIGRVDLETGVIANIPFDAQSQYLASVLKNSEVKPRYPNCPQRRKFAYMMAYGAISFLANHELAHCLNHLWPEQASLEERFAESLLADSREQCQRRHAMELEADLAAARSAFGLVYNDFVRGDRQCWCEELSKSELPAGLYPVMTGICLLFRVFGSPADFPIRHADFYRGSHPHPLVRSRIVGAHFSGFARGHSLEDHDGWVRAATIGFMSASEIWEALTGEKDYTLAQEEDHDPSGLGRVMSYYFECRGAAKPYLDTVRTRSGLEPMDMYRPRNPNSSRPKK